MSEWVTAARSELDRLTGTNAAKKRATIIALVDARLAGTPETAVFGRKDTCSRNIYHSKWKHDPDFALSLENITRIAREWHDGRALRALELAAERLALAAPVAAGRLVSLMQDQNSAVALRAAVGILDRAGKQTAAKQSVYETNWQDEVVEHLKRGLVAPAQVVEEFPELADDLLARAGIKLDEGAA
jgi:hypothetical protein